MHHAQDLIKLFNAQFEETEKTVLVKGQEEPLYQPASDETGYHQVIFAHGFFASALHEVAHWCIAGPERRQQVDYGYWYAPEGRSVKEQLAFAAVEAKPQALEWFFHQAAGHPFVISLDNLSADPNDFDVFKQSVVEAAHRWQRDGLPERARLFQQSLADFYAGSVDINDYRFDVTQLS